MTGTDRAFGPDLVIDGGHRSCVTLLLELRRRIQSLPDGAVVHLIAADPAAPIDLPAWCHLTGHTYLGRVDAPADDAPAGSGPTFALQVNAAARATHPEQPWRAV